MLSFIHLFFGVDFTQRPPKKHTPFDWILFGKIWFLRNWVRVRVCELYCCWNIFIFHFAWQSNQGHFSCAQYMFSTSWWGHLSFIYVSKLMSVKNLLFWVFLWLRWDCLSRGRRMDRWTDNSLAQTNQHGSSQIVSWNMMFVSIFKENILIFSSPFPWNIDLFIV